MYFIGSVLGSLRLYLLKYTVCVLFRDRGPRSLKVYEKHGKRLLLKKNAILYTVMDDNINIYITTIQYYKYVRNNVIHLIIIIK